MRGVLCGVGTKDQGCGELMTPVTDILAGMLCGTLMGLTASAHAAVLFTVRPPQLLQRRIAENGSTNLVTIIVFGLVVVWTTVGVLSALVADAVISDVTELSMVPSSEYLFAVVLTLVITGAPVMFFLRDRWMHGAFSLLLALGIYGFLIPNAVIALQNRA